MSFSKEYMKKVLNNAKDKKQFAVFSFPQTQNISREEMKTILNKAQSNKQLAVFSTQTKNEGNMNVKNVLEELNLKLNSMKGGKKQVVTRKRYEDRTVEELRHQAATRKISGCHSMKKAELIKSLRN